MTTTVIPRHVFIWLTVLIACTSCEKKESPLNLIATGTASDITEFSAKLSGYANPTPDMGTIIFGIIFSTDEKFDGAEADTLISNVLDGNNMFIVDVTDLEAGRKYYYKSFIKHQGIYRLGAVKSFTTRTINLETLSPTEITKYTAILHGFIDINNNEQLDISYKFICDGNQDKVKRHEGCVVCASRTTDGHFSASIKITHNERYYYSTLVTINGRDYYGNIHYFDSLNYSENNVVMLFYGAGNNNLSDVIESHVNTIKSCRLPQKSSNHKVLSFTHDRLLIHHFNRPNGDHACDTLLTIPSNQSIIDPTVIQEVISFIIDQFPNSIYGMIACSHGTGWVPSSNYSNGSIISFSKGKKGFGADYSRNELSIQSLAKAIPIKLEYIVFDACLMGGIEVAYELKDVASTIAFSPTEVMAEGFDYSSINCLFDDTPAPEMFCKGYFDYYNSRSSYATVSVVNTSMLSELASFCKVMFNKYKRQIASLDGNSGVQRYFRNGHHWYYDIRDIMVKAGINNEDLEHLDQILDSCISYKAATSSFLDIPIQNYSGLSMYLPSMGDSDLNEYYKTFAWNKATSLVN